MPRLFAVTPPGEYKLTFWGKIIREFKYIRKERGKKEREDEKERKRGRKEETKEKQGE